MSDLDRAVQAEIDAWAPRTPPPGFDALAGRKRARDRRRLATGGAALSAVAIVGAAALAPSLGGGRDELPTVTGSPVPTATSPGEDLDALVEVCLTGFTAAPVPDLVGMTELEAIPPNARSALRVLAQDGECTDERLAGDGVTYLVLEHGLVVWAGRLTAPHDTLGEALPVPADPSAATVCVDAVPDGGCRLIDRHKARDLAQALGTARRRQPGGVQCTAMPVPYVVTFAAGGAPAGPAYTVPSSCAPLRLDGASYDLGQDARDLVARLHQTAPVPPVDSIQSGTAPRSVALEQYACGLLPLALQGKEWVRPPFSPADPPDGFSGEGTATRKDDVVTYTDRLGAVIVLVPREPGLPLPDCA